MTAVWLACTCAVVMSGIIAWWLAAGGHRVAGDVPRVRPASSWWTVPISGVLAAAAGWWLPVPIVVPVVVTIVAGVSVSWIDIDVQRIPNRILLIWAPVQVMALLWAGWVVGDAWRWVHALVGAAAFGGVFLILGFVASMGMGDAKLAAVCGGLLGFAGWPGAVLQGMVLAAVLGGIAAVAIQLFQGRGVYMPYGPVIVAGTLVAVAFS